MSDPKEHRKLLKLMSKGGEVEVRWMEKVDRGAANFLDSRSKDKPALAMDEALKGLLEKGLTILQLPNGYAEGLRVVGVQIKYKKDGRPSDYRVYLIKGLGTATDQFEFKTPPIGIKVDLPKEFSFIFQEAFRYLDGERLEMELPFDSEMSGPPDAGAEKSAPATKAKPKAKA